LSKIDTASSGTEQNPTLANNLTKIGSTRSLEERQSHAGDRSAFAETPTIREFLDPSTKNSQDFFNPSREALGGVLGPVPELRNSPTVS
jgi:hypothetical protein